MKPIEYHQKKVRLIQKSPLPPAPKIATLEDLIRNGYARNISTSFDIHTGRITASIEIAGYYLASDGMTTCEAIRKLSEAVLDKAFEL